MNIPNLPINIPKDPLVKGHPLHAMLTDLPIGAIVVGLGCDALGLVSRQPAWRFTARAAHTSALVSGGAAALVGLWDYQAVPREHPARRVGALHGYLNAGAMGLLLASLLLRRGWREPASGRPNAAAVALAGLAFATLGVSGWLGGELVFHLGWRVVPAEHAEQLEDALRKQGEDSLIAQAHATVQGYEQSHSLLP
jgi:uncharacterized membrane protein